MKAMLILLIAALTQPAFGEAESKGNPKPKKHVVRVCDSQADPDPVHVIIYSLGKKLYAKLEQTSGDGDEYGEDLIQIYFASQSSDGTVIYKQLEGFYPFDARIVSKPTGKTTGAEITIFADGSARVTAPVGPTGGTVDDSNLSCSNKN